jgi:hypothetical protein
MPDGVAMQASAAVSPCNANSRKHRFAVHA